jgi:hypothetical protein
MIAYVAVRRRSVRHVEVLGAALGQTSVHAKALDVLDQTHERVIDDPPAHGRRFCFLSRARKTSEFATFNRPLLPWQRRARGRER